MKITDISEDIAQFPDRKGEIAHGKIQGIADEFPRAMDEHNKQTAQSQEMLFKLKERGKTNDKKFASPTFMSGYRKGVPALEALSYSIGDATSLSDEAKAFSEKFALDNLTDIVAAYKHDIMVCREAMDKIRSWHTHGLENYLLKPWNYYIHALEGQLHSFAVLAKKHNIKLGTPG